MYSGRITPEREQRVLELVTLGVPEREIAETMAIGRATIYRIKHGKRNPPKIPPETERRVIELLKTGLYFYREVARMCGVDDEYVNRRVRKLALRHNLGRNSQGLREPICYPKPTQAMPGTLGKIVQLARAGYTTTATALIALTAP